MCKWLYNFWSRCYRRLYLLSSPRHRYVVVTNKNTLLLHFMKGWKFHSNNHTHTKRDSLLWHKFNTNFRTILKSMLNLDHFLVVFILSIANLVPIRILIVDWQICMSCWRHFPVISPPDCKIFPFALFYLGVNLIFQSLNFIFLIRHLV